MALDDDAALGCGRTIEAVWANIDHPPTAHEATCEQCRAARTSLSTLQQITARYRVAEQAADTSDDPALGPSPSVRHNVLAIARAEIRRGRRIPVATTDRGPILISEQTLLALIRAAADSVPGVRTRRITTTGLLQSRAPAASREAAEVRITCRIAVSATVSIPRITVTVRERILVALARHIALDADTVDLIVEDLYDL